VLVWHVQYMQYNTFIVHTYWNSTSST